MKIDPKYVNYRGIFARSHIVAGAGEDELAALVLLACSLPWTDSSLEDLWRTLASSR